MVSSMGLRMLETERFSPNAKAKVSMPTLPAYIRNISISLEITPSVGVRDRLSPTVPSADTVSNSTALNGAEASGSMVQMASVAISTRNRQETNIASACASRA